ncbi:MAG TPA: DUF4235 domain-containing protein [Propionibacteriaceae bacterium]|nr:DUF4235 domain-containing protein [Propionibacteriaceae bacterium]
MNDKILEKAYPAIVGALTTFVAQFLVRKLWKVATGNTPPDPHDPDVPTREAVTWFVASSIGVGVAQMLMGRFANRKIRQWQAGSHS